MHNNIMAAGSRDRLPMLPTGRYTQRRSLPAVPVTENSLAIHEHTTVETLLNMPSENKAHFESEKEAIHLILTRIGDEIYSTVDNDQNAVECDNENVALANLIVNLKLDVNENKKIQKQLKKANASLTQGLTECKSILAETSRTLRESNSIRDSCLVALQSKQTEFKKYKSCNDRTIDYDKLEHKLTETLGLLAQKDIDIKEGLKLKAYEILFVKEKHDELVKQSLLTMSHYEGLVKEKIKVITDLKQKEDRDIDKMISMEKQLKFLNEIVYKRNQTIQTIHMLAPKGLTFNGRPTFANPMYLKTAQSEIPCLYAIPYDQSDPANRLVPNREETLTLERVIHKTNVSKQQLRSNQMKDKVVPNNSQVKNKKTKIEDHPRFSSISKKIKSVTACNDSLTSRTSNVNAICATCGKCLVDSDHFARVTKFLNDVNARTKKHNVVFVSTIKPNCTNKSVATPVKKTVASETTIQKSQSYYRMLYKRTSNISLLCNFVEKYMGTIRFGNDQFAPILGYGDLGQGNIMINKVFYVERLNHNLLSVDQFCDANLEVAFWKSTCFVRDLQGNDLLTGTLSVNKSSSPTNNSNQQDTLPSTNIHPTSKPSTPSAEENNDNQAEDAQAQQDEFINPLYRYMKLVSLPHAY
nr:integrase, catalytic region, zinc finger, CCHC-type, peptidase aspartic, catalytic [Tanacetum cinerariifolium]